MRDWEGVNEFVAVVDAGSFTGAARRLQCSVVNISRKVATLEATLAVRLLNRTTRKVTMTEAGQLFYQHCRVLVDGLQQAQQALQRLQQSPAGKLRVTAPVTYGERYIAPLLNRFVQQYPQLELDLVLTNQTLDLLEHNVDVAVRLGRLADSSLIARRLANRQVYVCGSPAYLNAHGTPLRLQDLSRHQCLLGSLDVWRFQEQGKLRTLRVHGRLRCNSGSALLDAARQGLGLVQLPDYYVKEALASGQLREVLADYRDASEGVWAVYSQNRQLAPKVAMLVDYLHSHLPQRLGNP